MPKTIAVIDGNSLMHRAYHAVPAAMNAPDGTPTNAAFGFMSMLLKFIEVAHPDAIVCAFDRGRPAFRMEELEGYKAQRPPMDQELKVQFPIIEGLLESMAIPVIALEGWEGDDILGTVAARDEKLGYRTLLVTGDKDAYQLATDLTQIVTTKKGISDVVIYGPAEVEERYGVRPDQFIDFLGLKGDSADNIPGVPGIGDKRAASMLQEFGNLEGIYDNLDSFKGKQLENLTNNRDMAFLSRKVATIVTDVDFDLDLESIAFPAFDPAKVTEAFKNVRFMSHLGKVLALQGVDASAVQAQGELEKIEPVSKDTWALDFIKQAIKKKQRLNIAWEQGAQDELFGPALTLVAATPEGSALLEGVQVQEALALIVKEGSFAACDVKKLLALVYPRDTVDDALVDVDDLLALDAFDVALAAYVLNSSQGGAELGTLVQEYLAATIADNLDAHERVLLEAAAVAKLTEQLQTELEEDGTLSVFTDIDMPLVAVLAAMERAGAAIDTEHLAQLQVSTAAHVEDLRAQIIEAAGEEFNVDSPKQLSHILFEVLGLPAKKKTKSGYSTNAQVLQELTHLHELPGLILQYREYAKINSTYIEALPRMKGGDGRVHSSFNEMVTTTGRLSSSDPNLQNIPVRTDFGRQIRECFIPLAPGELFLSADYSQIELRLLAHLSGDEHLLDAFCSGMDFHAQTASRVFDVPVDQVTPQLRSRAKAVNFGIVYGQQAFGLSQSLDIPRGEAQDMITRYFEAYPDVAADLDRVKAEAKELGYAETLYGRKRHIPELKSSNAAQRSFGERTAMNHPMQGTAADIIKLTMRQVAELLAERNMGATMMLQVHDELDFSVPEAEVEELSTLVKECMENVVELSVPLVVDVSYGKNWAEAH